MMKDVRKLADRFEGKDTSTKRNMAVKDFADYFDSQLSYHKFLEKAKPSGMSPAEAKEMAEAIMALGAGEKTIEEIVALARRPKSNTMSTKQMRKSWQKSKDEYHTCKRSLTKLESEQEALDGKVDDMRKKLVDARSNMLDMSRALEKSDIGGASHAVFYDSGDVSFIIDKNEVHLDVNDVGDCNMIDIKEYRKGKKKDEACAADLAPADDDEEYEDDDDEPEEDASDVNGADDRSFYDSWFKEFKELGFDF